MNKFFNFLFYLFQFFQTQAHLLFAVGGVLPFVVDIVVLFFALSLRYHLLSYVHMMGERLEIWISL